MKYIASLFGVASLASLVAQPAQAEIVVLIGEPIGHLLHSCEDIARTRSASMYIKSADDPRGSLEFRTHHVDNYGREYQVVAEERDINSRPEDREAGLRDMQAYCGIGLAP